MANMFSGNTEKKAPKDFNSCLKTDAVSSNLWHWAERIEKLGAVLFWLLIVGGSILAIVLSIQEEERGYYYSYTETVFSFGTFLLVLSSTALGAFLEYCTYHIIALLVGSLASIVQHTGITANIALLSQKPVDYQEPADETSSSKAFCTKMEEQHLGTCDVCKRNDITVRNCTIDDNNTTYQKSLCNNCLLEITKEG